MAGSAQQARLTSSTRRGDPCGRPLRRDARSRFERTPFSDAGTAIPAERAGVTYRTSEKERIKQRRAARLQVADRKADGLATSEALEF